MKIVWDENDKLFIEKIRNGEYDQNTELIRAVYNLFSNNTGYEYGITFKVTDPILANMFISNIMYNQDMNFEEVIGLKITSAGYSDKYRFIDKLDQISNLIETMKNEYNAKLDNYK